MSAFNTLHRAGALFVVLSMLVAGGACITTRNSTRLAEVDLSRQSLAAQATPAQMQAASQPKRDAAGGQ
ncbi:hypothetical protein V8J88_04005 [Massilia sp. W12]|uniref:hypothetical protein n=1 Tax=Massilia sp. W12 TaxID=3126507 RepID=UPI0030CFE527